MLPIRDTNRPATAPVLTYLIIAANSFCFLYQLSLPEEELVRFFHDYGMVPARLSDLGAEGSLILPALILPIFTSMFLHGGWLHLLGNMWFLHIFGNNVEDAAGKGRFLFFYFACGALANLAQFGLNPESDIPVVGASGAIAGILGAYLVSWPAARILTIVPIFYFITFIKLPALIVLGLWFVLQLFEGVASLSGPQAPGGIAYGAHVAGFIAGMVLIKLMPLKRPPR